MNKKKKGFCVIESLMYIFIVYILVIVQIHMFLDLYKYYIDIQSVNLKYNNMQNFYVNLSQICSGENIEEIQTVGDDSLYFYSSDDAQKDKKIKSYEGKVKIKYEDDKGESNINIMLMDIDSMKVKKKENLIYIIIKDKEGKEFIRCMPKGLEVQS